MDSLDTASIRLAVDLDGTLIATDLLWESAVRYLGQDVLAIPRMIGWVARGKVRLKNELAARVNIDVTRLPYRPEVIEYVERSRAAGATIALATASSRAIAVRVAEHLAVFETVLATDERTNLRSEAKADRVNAYFRGEPWTYVGDSAADLPVWRESAQSVLVNPRPAVQAAVRALGRPMHTITTSRAGATVWLRQLRMHQWVKNLLLFLPLLTAHLLFDPRALFSATLGFLSFSFVASAVYIWNDLKDLDTDRAHATKYRRPIASGGIGIPQAIAASAVLGISGAILAALVSWTFLLAVLVYVIVTTAYTMLLKRRVIVDVVTLALLYSWRVLAGCVAIGVVPSIWVVAFSTFLFFSLAVMKRYAELVNHDVGAAGRGYSLTDTPLLLATGIGAGLISVLVVVLYLDSPQATELYARPLVMWALVPLLLYWIVRAWFVAGRGGMHDDPVLFAVRDRSSFLVLLLAAAVVACASF